MSGVKNKQTNLMSFFGQKTNTTAKKEKLSDSGEEGSPSPSKAAMKLESKEIERNVNKEKSMATKNTLKSPTKKIQKTPKKNGEKVLSERKEVTIESKSLKRSFKRVIASDSEEDSEKSPVKGLEKTFENGSVKKLAMDEEVTVQDKENSQDLQLTQEVFEEPMKKENPVVDQPMEISVDSSIDFSSSVTLNKTPAKNEKMYFQPISKKMSTEAKEDGISYGELCKVFEKIEATTKRLQILDFLVEFLVDLIKRSPSSLLPVVYLCLNKLGPEYEGVELGIGESLLMKAIAMSSGQNIKSIKSDLIKMGDLGDVAQASKATQKTMIAPKAMNVKQVYKQLKEIALFSGTNSQQKKVDKIGAMMVSCTESEPKYLIRSLEGKLRIGLAEQTVLVALAHAAVLSKENPRKEDLADILEKAAITVKSVYNALPSYDRLVPVLLEHGVSDLSKYCSLTPGIPLKPMLAHPTKSLSEVLDRFEGIEFTCEFKYDGERAQIHRLPDGQGLIFSRNSENLSAKYPDILGRISKSVKPNTESFVLDCEAVAWDVQAKSILPFQVLSTRKRKDVEEKDIQVQVCIFAFDLLYLNGKSVTSLTLKERRELLQNHFIETEGEFLFAKHLDTKNIDEMQSFLEDSMTGNCEGLMVKTLDKDSTYEPSKRSRNWLKVKKDYLSGVGDTVDLVVIGGFNGRGKRTGVYGGYLLACYDDENDEYQSICKIGTGFSDQDLASQADFFKSHIIQGPKPYYKFSDNPNITPDVWFDAVQVWEVKCADLSISPVHQAGTGIVDPNKGISLRFPRFIRIRDDKSPEQATNSSQVAALYRNQQVNSSSTKNVEEED